MYPVPRIVAGKPCPPVLQTHTRPRLGPETRLRAPPRERADRCGLRRTFVCGLSQRRAGSATQPVGRREAGRAVRKSTPLRPQRPLWGRPPGLPAACSRLRRGPSLPSDPRRPGRHVQLLPALSRAADSVVIGELRCQPGVPLVARTRAPGVRPLRPAQEATGAAGGDERLQAARGEQVETILEGENYTSHN